MSMVREVMQAKEFASEILEGRMSDREIADRLQCMRERGESAEEIMGMISAFYPHSRRVATVHPMVMDLCGTGGAPVRTFNISTTSSFVLAAAGVPVAKHGNRSSIGRCGSADLLESMGANISPGIEISKQMLDRIGFAFFFAPLYHPAMRHASKARKIVSSRTVFNVMGPLMNPVLGRRRQLMGVSSIELLDVVPEVLDKLGVEEAMVVHGLPGMDEVSPCDVTLVVHLRKGEVERYEIEPEEMGFCRCPSSELAELAPQSSARCCYEILIGQSGARRDAVLMNCACALLVSGKVNGLSAGVSLAERTIDSGRAYQKMRDYIAASQGEP